MEDLSVRLFAIVFAAGLAHWYRKVNRADISPFKASLFYFAVAMGFIFVMLWHPSETIKIFSALFASYQIFVAAVHLITNDSEKYQFILDLGIAFYLRSVRKAQRRLLFHIQNLIRRRKWLITLKPVHQPSPSSRRVRSRLFSGGTLTNRSPFRFYPSSTAGRG